MTTPKTLNGGATPLSDDTEDKQNGEKPWRFQPGQSGNPSGRPKGARNKINTKFLEAFAKHFEDNGEAAIAKVYADKPELYLKIAADLLPKQMQIEDQRPTRRAEELTDDELAAIAYPAKSGQAANGSQWS
jgi:hypothetical protein